MTDTYWDGLPCYAVRGTAIVSDCGEDGFWDSELVGKRIVVVQVIPAGVTEKNEFIYLDNRAGAGWALVTKYDRRSHPNQLMIKPDSWINLERNHHHIPVYHHDSAQQWCSVCGMTEEFLQPILSTGLERDA